MEEGFVPDNQHHEEEVQPLEEAPVEVDWSKRYNDLRPAYDRTVSENSQLKQEVQEMRLRALEVKQQAPQPQVQEQPEQVFFSEETKTVEKDFPDIFKGVQEHINYALHQQGSSGDMEKIKHEAEAAKQEAENARIEVEQIRIDSQLSSALGANVWPAVDSNPAFRDWVSADRMRLWQMQMGDTQHKIDCVTNFLTTPDGQQFSGNAPQQNVARRQEVQGLMGGQVPATPGGKSNWNGMTEEQRWESVPEYEVN